MHQEIKHLLIYRSIVEMNVEHGRSSKKCSLQQYVKLFTGYLNTYWYSICRFMYWSAVDESYRNAFVDLDDGTLAYKPELLNFRNYYLHDIHENILLNLKIHSESIKLVTGDTKHGNAIEYITVKPEGEMRWLYTMNRTLNNLYLNNRYMVRTYNRFDADFEEHRNNVIRHQIGFVNDDENFHDAEEEV